MNDLLLLLSLQAMLFVMKERVNCSVKLKSYLLFVPILKATYVLELCSAPLSALVSQTNLILKNRPPSSR